MKPSFWSVRLTQVGHVLLFARGAVLIPKCPLYRALSGCRKWLPQVTFRKTVCCRGHRGQGLSAQAPLLVGKVMGVRGQGLPARRPRCWWEVTGSGARAWWQEARAPFQEGSMGEGCFSGHHALGPQGAPHSCWDTPASLLLH